MPATRRSRILAIAALYIAEHSPKEDDQRYEEYEANERVYDYRIYLVDKIDDIGACRSLIH